MKKINKENIIAFIKKNKKPLIIFGVVIIALIIGLIVSSTFNKEQDNPKKEEEIIANTNPGVIKDEEYEGLKFSNISLITQNGYSTFTADVTNITESDNNISDVNIVLQDKNGKTVITLRGNIGETLKANETRTITAVTKGKFGNVTDKEIIQYENTAQE